MKLAKHIIPHKDGIYFVVHPGHAATFRAQEQMAARFGLEPVYASRINAMPKNN